MLWGRTDLEKYAQGLRRCRNFFISRGGAAVSRPGTKYICEVKDSARQVRLIPFIYSDSQSYVLEFGHLYVRFVSNGAQVLSGTPYEIVSPYSEADLDRLKYAQTGDLLTITHPSYAPRTLTRTGHTSWAFATLSFNVRPFESPALPGLLLPLPTPTASNPAREWIYKVTVVEEDPTGLIWESAPYKVVNSASVLDPATRVYAALSNNNLAIYPDDGFQTTLVWSAVAAFTPTNKLLAYRIYRGRGELYGLIGETASTSFVDSGAEPDYSQPPPQGRNPFVNYDAAGVAQPAEEPATVTFFEQRRVFGGTVERPESVFLSATNDYSNFDERFPSLSNEKIELELASRKREEIRWMVGLDKLLIGTNSSIWSVGGAGGEPITPDSIEAHVQSEVGTTWVDPVVAGDTLLFARAKGLGLRDLYYSAEAKRHVGSDLTALVPHLFYGLGYGAGGGTAKRLAYAEDPWSIVWVVRADGKLLSFTYDRGQQVWAWAWHDTPGISTDADIFEDVCSVPEDESGTGLYLAAEDAVYVVVKRTIYPGVIKRYIERLSSRVRPVVDDVKEMVCLDSAITWSGSASSPQTVSGLAHLQGRTVYAVVNGVPSGPLTVASGQVTVAHSLEVGSPIKIHVGVKYLPELEALDHAGARLKQKTVKKVGWEVESSRGLQVGEDFDHLRDWKPPNGWGGGSGWTYSPTAMVPINIGLVEVIIKNTWNKFGRVVLRQNDPMPVTVYGLEREVDLGG